MKEDGVCLVRLDVVVFAAFLFRGSFVKSKGAFKKANTQSSSKSWKKVICRKMKIERTREKKSSKAALTTYTISQKSLQDTIKGGRNYCVS
uniref:Uncharacterized protein n=1 Tax=Amphimedon queenslandica TaxID=400682 RepID=A0A1X7V1F4_AMPQE